MNMSSENDNKAKLDDLFNTSKPQEKPLLDNVSFMTTLSPMPSQNNSLQPGSSFGTKSSQEDGKFLDKIRSKLLDERITEEHEKSNISTLTAFEDQLHDYLKGTGSTAASSTPATTEIGTGQVMYGFDLSPVHSLEKKPVNTLSSSLATKDNQRDLSSKMTTQHSFQKQFEPAPNFMQAKVASPRQLTSGKSKINEDTETVMSQVFSSQDVTSSLNGKENRPQKKIISLPKHKGDKQKKQTVTIHKHTVTPAKESKSATSVYQSRLQQGNIQNYSNHSRKPRTSQKSTPKSKTTSNMVGTFPVKSARTSGNVMTPKSPKSRQTAVKVTPKIKTALKSKGKKQTSPKSNIKSRSNISLQDSSKLLLDSTAFSETDFSFTDKRATSLSSPYPSPNKMNSEESAAFIRSLEEIDQMRSQVKDVEEKLAAMSSEKDQILLDNKMISEENEKLKKDNYVMKSKISQLISEHRDKKHESVGKDKDISSDDEVSRLKQEIFEQDKLISGYQRENERIYADLKEMKQASKDMENAMYKENLKLKTEIANLQENLDGYTRQNVERQDKIGMAANFSDRKLNDEDSNLKKRITSLENQVRMEEGMRSKAELSVKRLTDERDEAEKQLRINELKAQESRDKLISEHKIELEKAKSDLAEVRRSLGNKADALTIRDLTNTPPSKSVLFHFQARVKKLETELENCDKVANKAVQQVQDDYNNVRMKYEERIDDLEKQIKAFRMNMEKGNKKELARNGEDFEKKFSEVAIKLQEEKEARATERNVMMSKIQSLQQNIPTSPSKNNDAAKSKLIALKNECEAKDKEIEKLTSLLHKTFEKNESKKLSTPSPSQRKGNKNQTSSYNPGVFEADGYAGLLQENGELKKQLESQDLELKHNKVTNEALLVRLEQETRTMKADHEKELLQLRNRISNTTDVAQNQWMEPKIEHLQKELEDCHKQISVLRNELKESSVSRIREQALQVQVQQLVGEIHQSNSHSPSASTRRVAALENKLRVLGEEFRLKEENFKKALISNSSSFMQNEVYKLQEQLNIKNKELTRFRLELDSILLVLREIHSQGVKIPLPQYLQSIF